MSGKLPLVLDGGQMRQIRSSESINSLVTVEGGAGLLALALVRQLIYDLDDLGIPLSPELLEQLQYVRNRRHGH